MSSYRGTYHFPWTSLYTPHAEYVTTVLLLFKPVELHVLLLSQSQNLKPFAARFLHIFLKQDICQEVI